MDNKVLLPEPDAPTMAQVSLAASWKSISRKMSSVPVESVTDLNTCSTAIIESLMQQPYSMISKLAFIFLALYMVTVSAFSKTADVKAKSNMQPVRILVVGDSLSAEYGLKRGSGWVALLETVWLSR